MKKKYLITGLLTAIPIWLTYLVISFIFKLITDTGMPLVIWLSDIIVTDHPTIVAIIQHSVFKNIIAVILIIVFLYLLGWLTTKVLGRKIIRKAEELLEKIRSLEML